MNIQYKRLSRVSQGDIYKDIEFLEYVVQKKGVIEIAKIMFPYVIVLTQDCDLEQDSKIRNQITEVQTQDKLILSVLVAPIYNVEQVFIGEHLKQLKVKMQLINKNSTQGRYLINNEIPRYHHIDFPAGIPIPSSVIDFKHYFSVNVKYLRKKKGDFVCRVSPLYREDISHRFASFLSRIGLPEVKTKKQGPLVASSIGSSGNVSRL